MQIYPYHFLLAAILIVLAFCPSKAAITILQDNGEIHISGKISDPEGNPIKDISVELVSTPWGNPDIGEMVDGTRTDSEGRYSVTYVPTSIDRDQSRENQSTFELGSDGTVLEIVFKPAALSIQL